MDNMGNNMCNDNDCNDVERIAERVGTEILGRPCDCRVLKGLKPFEFVASPDDDARMRVGLPIAIADLPEYIEGVVLGEVFKAINGDPSARPSAALNAAYHTMADALVDFPGLVRDPALDDAMAMYIDKGLVPEYSTALVFNTPDVTACAMPIHSACSCALSRRLVDAVKDFTATYEEETRVLALALAYPLGLVMSGFTDADEGGSAGLALAQALDVPDEDFAKLHEIINGL